jgi:hypothetical protein
VKSQSTRPRGFSELSVPLRQAGYDATDFVNGATRCLQIKGRYIPAGAGRSQRMGSINIHKDFDAVLLVLHGHDFDVTEIWEADRAAVVKALTEPGSRARNERFAMAVSKFKSVGFRRWPKGD